MPRNKRAKKAAKPLNLNALLLDSVTQADLNRFNDLILQGAMNFKQAWRLAAKLGHEAILARMHTQPRLELDWEDVFRVAAGAGQFKVMNQAKSFGAKNSSLVYAEAVRRGRKDVMTYLNVRPDSQSLVGAARGNQVELGQELLSEISDVAEGMWKPVLRAACRSGSTYFVQLALQHTTHTTESIQAIFRGGHQHLFDPVLQNQVIQFGSKDDLQKYLLAACRGNHEYFIQFALDCKAPRSSSTSAALSGNHVELAKRLFPNDPFPHMAFPGAMKIGSWDMVRYLIDQWAEENYEQRVYHALLSATCNGQTTFAKELWSWLDGAEPDSSERDMEWLLRQACAHNNYVLAEFYLAQNMHIRHAITGAVTGGHTYLMRLYVNRSPDFQNAAHWALFVALVDGQLEIAKEWFTYRKNLDVDSFVARVLQEWHHSKSETLLPMVEWFATIGATIPWNAVLCLSTESVDTLNTVGAMALAHGAKLIDFNYSRKPEMLLYMLQHKILEPTPDFLAHYFGGSYKPDGGVVGYLLSMGIKPNFTYKSSRKCLDTLIENGLPVEALKAMSDYESLRRHYESLRPPQNVIQFWLPIPLAAIVVSYFP